MTKISNWLSNKWNLIGIYILSSIYMGVIMYSKLTFIELIIIYTLMIICSIITHIMGIGRGMFLYAIQKKELDDFIKKLLKDDK